MPTTPANADIRSAAPDDAAALHAVAQAAYALYVPRMNRRPAPMDEDYAGLIRDNSVYVLEDERGIAGFVVLLQEGEVMLLDNVAVEPRAQGLGYGRELMGFAEKKARKKGCTRLRLYTNEVMVENLDLYAHLGFAETHRAVEKGFRRVYMIKELREKKS